jgi:hypothetical protein
MKPANWRASPMRPRRASARIADSIVLPARSASLDPGPIERIRLDAPRPMHERCAVSEPTIHVPHPDSFACVRARPRRSDRVIAHLDDIVA